MNTTLILMAFLIGAADCYAAPKKKEAPSPKGTEYFYQPAAGKNAVILSLGIVPEFESTISNKNGTKLADVKSSGNVFSLDYTNGISDSLAWGIGIGYRPEISNVKVSGISCSLNCWVMENLD